MIARVSTLPAALAKRVADHNLIIFDGECVLCSAFYRFVLRVDTDQRFVFATAQSDLGQAFFRAMGMPTTDFETNLVITDGTIHTHLDSVAAVMRRVGWPWRIFALVRWLPGWIKTPLYRTIARNRFRMLGRYDTCLMPDAEAQIRFLPGGWEPQK